DQLGNIQSRQGDDVGLIGARAIFRRNFVEDARPAETGKRHFDKRIVLVESRYEFLRITKVGGGVESDGAFLPSIFGQQLLPLLRRQAVGFFQKVLYPRGKAKPGGKNRGRGNEGKRKVLEPHSLHNIIESPFIERWSS